MRFPPFPPPPSSYPPSSFFPIASFAPIPFIIMFYLSSQYDKPRAVQFSPSIEVAYARPRRVSLLDDHRLHVLFPLCGDIAWMRSSLRTGKARVSSFQFCHLHVFFLSVGYPLSSLAHICARDGALISVFVCVRPPMVRAH